jgi:hypothetical protein
VAKGYAADLMFETLAVTAVMTWLFWWQPAPVKFVLGWSGNLGPAMEPFKTAPAVHSRAFWRLRNEVHE